MSILTLYGLGDSLVHAKEIEVSLLCSFFFVLYSSVFSADNRFSIEFQRKKLDAAVFCDDIDIASITLKDHSHDQIFTNAQYSRQTISSCLHDSETGFKKF